MAELQIACFGGLQVTFAQIALTTFPTDKARALLAYLANEGQVHQRTELAQFLWSGYSAESARNNLRQTLHHLRQLLRDDEAEPPWLLLTRQTVQLNPAARIRVDVQRFTQLRAECTTHVHAELTTCAPCLARLRQAVELYKGDFLAGLPVVDSIPFEEWRRLRQEQLRLQMLDMLNHLAVAAERTGDNASALWVAQRQVTIEPWMETAQRQIMRILAERGEQAAALAQYEHCQQTLAATLGVTPDAETTALYLEIQRGAFEQKARSKEQGAGGKEQGAGGKEQGAGGKEQGTEDRGQKAEGWQGAQEDFAGMALRTPHSAFNTRLDWGEMPAVDFFAGRAPEVAQLTAWLAPSAPTRIVSILGLGGIGKTTLAAAVTKAVAPHFGVVIWRSLLNAPPLNELLRNWLQILSRQTLQTLPGSLDEQLRLLIVHLRQERCLLVLDNVESIFTADDPHSQAGAPRPGYEGYDQLLQRLASSDHQSCLLLTSREQPHALVRLGRQAQEMTGRLRVLPLAGLDEQAGRALLQSNGLDASVQEAAHLVESYSGNPLALQIVAGAIADFFGGDVAAFTQEAGGLFDGIRLVLDQQFARLSPLEREILVWLAIEREAVTVQTLRSNFVQPVATRDLIEALHALQNRSLLEKRGDGLTLQNVIIEYTTDYLVEQVCREMVGDRETRRQGDKERFVSPVSLSPGLPVSLSFLNRFALLKAQAKEYVRQSQARLLLQPVADRLVTKVGKAQVAAALPHLLDTLRTAEGQTGYAAGNLLNLLLALSIDDGRGFDFSGLNLREAFLQGKTIHNLNFCGADLTQVVFTDSFSLINSVTINPAQTLIAAGTGAGEIRIWHYANRQPSTIIQGKQKPVWAVLFSPDGRRLASSDDQTVQLWEIGASGELVGQPNGRTLRGHTGDVHTLAFSPDAKTLASGSYDQSICLWDVASGVMVQRLNGHSSYVYSLAFSPDGRLLASGSDDQTVRLWDLQSQQCRILHGHRGRVYGVAFQPQGRLLATCSTDHSVRLWDVARGALCQTLLGHTDIVRAVAFHPTGAWVASGGYDETIRVWALHDAAGEGVRGEISQILNGHTAWVRSLTFSPDGETLVSGSIDSTVRMWGLQGGLQQVHHVLHGHTNLIRAVAISPDGGTLVSGSNDHAVRIWDISQRERAQVRQILCGHTRMIRTVAFHPGGQMIASGGFDKSIRLWVKVAGQWRLQHTLTGHNDLVRSVAFSPDGVILASAGSDQTIRLWDVTTGQHLHTLCGGNGTVWSVAFHPDGQTLASGSADFTIRLWQLDQRAKAPRLYASWRAHAHEIKTIAFSPDGQTLASGSDDKTIRLWDLHEPCQAPRPQQIFSGHTDTIWSLAFRPDGQTLASCSADKTIRLWNLPGSADNRWSSQSLEGHTSWVWTVAFHPDGQTLVSSSDDETIRLWDLSSPYAVTPTVLRIPGPYAGMNIREVTGISEAQKVTLRALGAVEA
ncbi:MAG: BTAD domain-containing putative transcriptional regulator [Caldilineaceae bacterium]